MCMWSSLCQWRWIPDASHQPRQQDQDPSYTFIPAAESLSKYHVVSSWWWVGLLIHCQCDAVHSVSELLYMLHHKISCSRHCFILFSSWCGSNIVTFSGRVKYWDFLEHSSANLLSVGHIQVYGQHFLHLVFSVSLSLVHYLSLPWSG